MAAVRPDQGASQGETGSASRPGESLEELFLSLEGPLLCYALRLAKERDMAEDVVQEAFLRLQSQPAGSIREPRSWLYRTVHNLTVDQLRPDVRWARIADPTWPHPGGRPTIDVAGPAAAEVE